MWLFNTGPTGEATGTGAETPNSPFGMFKEMDDAAKNAFNVSKLQGFFVALEDSAVKLNKTIGNGILANQQKLSETLYNLYESTLEYGAKLQDSTDFLSGYADELGRLPNIQEELIKNAVVFSKASGVSAKEVGTYVSNMAKVGIGQDTAINKLNKVYLTAKKFGVNAQDLTKTVATNIDKASMYGFKNGVDGLTKMAARAQQLGLKMEDVMKTAAKAFDPDEAIKMASEIQMLGGAVGALGDPFQLLYLAQNDIGKLQEEIVKATQGSVEFNEATGEFKLPVSEMYRMKEMADKLGISYDELAKGAINAKKQQEVLARSGGLTQYSEEDRNLIASLSEIKGGQVLIKIPGSDSMIEASKVTQDDLKKLRENAEAEGKTPQQLQAEMNTIAKNQLSAQDNSNITLKRIESSLIFAKGVDGVKDYTTLLDKVSGLGNTMADVITATVKQEGLIDKIDAVIDKQVTNFNEYVTLDANLKADIRRLITEMEKIYAPGANNKFQDVDDFLGKKKEADGTIKVTDGYLAPGNDLIDLSAIGKKTYTDGFGKMWELNKNDQVLAMPNVDELFNFSNKAYETLSTIQKSTSNMDYGSLTEMLSTKQGGVEKIDYGQITEMLMSKINPVTTQPEQITNLQDILSRSVPKMNEIESININQTNTTTQKVEGNVGVDGNVNINVNVPNGLLSNALSGDREFQQTLKEEIMNVVNDRLSKAYSQRQGNFSS